MRCAVLLDDERCHHTDAPTERDPLTITEAAIEIACAVYGVTVFIALILLVGAR